ncbi:MAG: helix-turn-helix transcriptional regulator [Ruminococcaceae bacterium]|nr:helix-turn-helix transcriptional regulator [Oscillospiraceae bacterium]
MEKKTIGQFICVLRKAHGMTQAQLAEKLNVSDKAVSRWERDESAPDLTLIPIIAEIFGVTSDEILRGERASDSESCLNESRISERSEKQIIRLLDKTKERLNICSIISVGIALVGLIAAMICNFGFYRAYIGFYVACIFYLSAIVCEVISLTLTFGSVKSGDFEDDIFNSYKRSFFKTGAVIISVTAVIFASTLPLIIIPWDSHIGIMALTWFVYGLLSALVASLVCFVLVRWAKSLAVKKKLYYLSEEETDRANQLAPLKKKSALLLCSALALTFFIQLLFNGIVTPRMLASSKDFTDLEEFKKYIETEAYSENDAHFEIIPIDPNYSYGQEDDVYDYIYDKSGENVLLQYVHRNRRVKIIEYKWESDGSLTLVTYTDTSLESANVLIDIINIVFLACYFIEIIVTVFIYFSKKKTLCR